jgi:NAD(P)-dependent dehydrogenase (short-subunit alcohol dehydrogenase family)
MDVRSSAALAEVVAECLDVFSRLDVVVANAGIFSRTPLWEMDDRTWTDVLDINLTGTWRTIKAVAPHMIERHAGSIVLISSVSGVEGNSGAAHYTASKHGVLGLMKSAAQELSPYRVRGNAICPGLIDTPMVNWPALSERMAGRPGGTRADFEAASRHSSILGGHGALLRRSRSRSRACV